MSKLVYKAKYKTLFVANRTALALGKQEIATSIANKARDISFNYMERQFDF